MMYLLEKRERWMISIASLLTLVFMLDLFGPALLVGVVIFDVSVYFAKSLTSTGILGFVA